jgi:predicted acylesterase/phospholipase RssA
VARDYLERLHDGIDRMHDMLERLMQLGSAWSEALQPVQIALAEGIRQLTAEFKPLLEDIPRASGIGLRWVSDPGRGASFRACFLNTEPVHSDGEGGVTRPAVGKIQHVRVEEETASGRSRGETAALLRFRAPDGTYYLPFDDAAEARQRGVRMAVLRSLAESDVPVEFVLPHAGAVCDHPPDDARLAVLARMLSEERAGGDLRIRFLGRNRSVPPDGFVLDRAGGKRCYVWQVIPGSEAANAAGLRDRFRAIRELFGDPDSRVALALGSGGLKLFAHAPVLRFLEAIGCAEHVDEIWGTSGGAIAGLLYALGLSPQAIEQSGYDLYSGRYKMSLTPSRLQVLRHLLRDTLLGSSTPGFFDAAGPLSRMIETYCASLGPRQPFYSVAFNLSDCCSQVLTSEPVPDHLSDWVVRTDAREAALASSAVPLLYVPRTIRDGESETHYIDGSTTEDVPLYSVARKWDADREAGVESRRRLVILSVKLTGGVNQYRSSHAHAHARVGKLRMLQVVAAAAIETMHRRDVALLEQRPDVELLALELGNSPPDFFDIDRIPQFVAQAKESFPPQLAAIETELRSR